METPMAPKPGPHLVAAVLCEKVLQEKDGVLSLIRIIDRLIITATGTNVPSEMPPQTANLTLVVALKSGDAQGRHTLGVQPELPSTDRLPKQQLPLLFEGEDRGVNTIVRMALPITQEGVYWIDITLDDVVLTRIPLRILYQPIQATG
jgi:uncharacterized protein DUF6941